MPEKEIWKDVKGYVGYYQVSNLGRVRSFINTRGNKRKAPMILKNSFDKRGYLFVLLSKNSNRRKFTVHRLVAQAFIPNPDNKREVNHINGIKSDNRVENLEWATQKENIRHAWDNNLYQKRRGEKRYNAKFTNEQAKQIRAEYILGSRTRGTVALAKKYGVGTTTIRQIVNNKTYKNID